MCFCCSSFFNEDGGISDGGGDDDDGDGGGGDGGSGEFDQRERERENACLVCVWVNKIGTEHVFGMFW